MRLLFYPLHRTSYPKHLEIALAARERNQCAFLITNRSLYSEVSKLIEFGFEVWIEDASGTSMPMLTRVSNAALLSDSCEKTSTVLDRGKDTASVKIIRWMARLIPGQLKKYLYYRRLQRQSEMEYEAKLTQVVSLLDKSQPDKIILCGDRHLQYEPAMIKIGVDRSIPMIIPPVSVFSTPEQLAKSRVDKSGGAHLVNSYYKCDPRGCFSGKGTDNRNVSIYFPWVINALARKQLLSSNPWILGGSGNVDMLVSGNMVKDLLIEYGVPRSRVFVTGDAEYDDLIVSINRAKVKRQEVAYKYQLDSKKRMIAISLPQWWEHKLTDEEYHWSSIELICSTAARLNSNVLISLHPKMDPAQYESIINRHGLTKIDEPLSSWLPICDLLIASQGSSTHIWAMISKIPVLVIDWLGLDNNPFNIVLGKHIVLESDKFEQELDRLLNDSSYYDQLVFEQTTLSNQYLFKNGSISAKQRILEHIETPKRQHK